MVRVRVRVRVGFRFRARVLGLGRFLRQLTSTFGVLKALWLGIRARVRV